MHSLNWPPTASDWCESVCYDDDSSCSLPTHNSFSLSSSSSSSPPLERNNSQGKLTLRGWCSSSGTWWVWEGERSGSPPAWTCPGAASRSGILWPQWAGGRGSGGTLAGTVAGLYPPPEEDHTHTHTYIYAFTCTYSSSESKHPNLPYPTNSKTNGMWSHTSVGWKTINNYTGIKTFLIIKSYPRKAGLTFKLKPVLQVAGTNSMKGKVKSILSVSPHAARYTTGDQ